PERREEAERNGLAVRDGAGRARLQSVRERVAEVEHRPLAPVERVTETNGRLECGAAADELGLRQLPERLPRQQAGLDDLREAVAPLAGGKRPQDGRIDDRPGRPVERTDEVLRLGEVERRLAADRRVDLADERR